MSWIEIVVEVERAQAEQFSDALMEFGALSVSVEDADEGTDAEQPLFGEPGMEPKEAAWEHSRVVALTGTQAQSAFSRGSGLGAVNTIAVRTHVNRRADLGRA
jgi:ribosomal protein L11 methyltransferase